MIFALMAMVIAVTRLFPDTATGRFLHRWLAEEPAAWLAAIERKHVIFLLLAALLVVALREAVPMIGAADMALFAMWDASVYLDVVMAAWTIAALARGRSGWAVVRLKLVAALGQRRQTGARRRARRARMRVRPPANDDDGPGVALIAA